MDATPKIRTLAVMTAGGDAPGMNPCIRAVVRTALNYEMKVLGVVGGFDGLIRGNFTPLGARDVGGILQRGGTILQTARSKTFLEPFAQQEALRQLNAAGVDALVVIGGGGSQRGALALHQRGVPVVGVPASIDNDIYGTDICIGVDTALNTIVDAIDKLRDTASSHNRAFLVETMGHESGYLALQAGIISGAELVLIPEIETSVEAVAQAIQDAYRRGKTHAIIVAAEGARPSVAQLASQIDEMEVGFTMRVTILGHIQRGGKPSAFDRLLASRLGTRAVELLREGRRGVMVGLSGREVVAVDLADVASRKRELPMEYYQMAITLAR
ncbi:6-phosphofructokinase [Thermanaerothrix daxensis]|uniref:6-phosphofructokinase n=1 Tax=Thermanaerothrix daxensis TaxID=869279 RepID=UPI000AC8C44F|nr:6-phosphofructokinase [Thermanaerothrix daxensis]